MIDNITEVNTLIGKIKENLPVSANPAKSFIHLMRNQGVKLKAKSEVLIKKVMYLGDEGGIACEVVLPGKQDNNVLITSLTHLRVKTNHPLAKDIRTYQINRTNKLARQGDY